MEKERIVQEYVPGRQITLAHLIANPKDSIYSHIGLPEGENNGIGILTITPGEAVIIAADVATKSSSVEIGFLDRFSGSLVLVGKVGSVESALQNVINMLGDRLAFAQTELTRT